MPPPKGDGLGAANPNGDEPVAVPKGLLVGACAPKGVDDVVPKELEGATAVVPNTLGAEGALDGATDPNGDRAPAGTPPKGDEGIELAVPPNGEGPGAAENGEGACVPPLPPKGLG